MRKKFRFYHAVSLIMYLCLTVLLFQAPADSATYTNTKTFSSTQGLSYNYSWQQCLSGFPPGATIDSAQIQVRAKVFSWGYSPYKQDILASDNTSFNFSEGYVYSLNPTTNPNPSKFYTTSYALTAPQLEWIQNNGCINFMMVTYGGTYYLDFATLTVEATEKISTPAFTPLPGPYNTAQDVNINCDTPGVTLYYTTNGTDPDENSTLYNGTAIHVSATTTIKARAFKDGRNPSDIGTGDFIIDSGNKTTLYLRDHELMSEEMGHPVPWLRRYIYPQGTTSIQLMTTLEGDITGFFHYSVDIVGSAAPATLKVEFILDQDGVFSTLATDYTDVGVVIEGSEYQTVTKTIGGLDLPTQDGDILIFKISYESGTEKVAVALDGQDVYSDSHIRISYLGPVACFSVSPSQGDLNTEFNFDAACSFDNIYQASELQVRWDWGNDGTYDTGYAVKKMTSHKFTASGVKFVKLQVRNPDGITRTRTKQAVIDWVVLNSFSSPGPAPAGLTMDGVNMWLSDTNNDLIYKITPDGQVIDSFASPCGDPLDLAWDGTYLWIIDARGSDGKGNVLYKVDHSGAVITSFNLPADYSTGLTWDGHFLWAADGTNGRIAKIDPNTGSVVLSFASPGPAPRGLAWDGQYLWNADWTKHEIYRLDVNGNVMGTYPSPGTGPMGLTWDGSNLWCVDLDSYTIYKLTDKIPTTITCEPSQMSLTLGEPLTITGKITPSPGTPGIGVSIEFTPPSGGTIYKSTLTDINGNFSYTLDCKDINIAGTWSIQTRWVGYGPYVGATGTFSSLIVNQAVSNLTLDIVMSEAIKINTMPPIGGKFTPAPSCVNKNLSGIPIILRITEPLEYGAAEHLLTVYTNQNGQFLLDYNAGGFAFDKLGEWKVKVEFEGNEAYQAVPGSNSPEINARVVPTAGYALIVQGKSASGEGLASHLKTTNFVYEKLKQRQLLDDDIKYFAWDNSNPAVDALPSKNAIQTAIASTLKNKMIAKAGDLYIVMVDHGWTAPGDPNAGEFYIDPEVITANDLKSWLDQLQTELSGTAAADRKIVVILGFCRAGAFIEKLSGNNRIIVASAAKDEYSHRGPQDVDDSGQPLRDGEYFISEFFRQVLYGHSLKQGFNEATALTETFTSTGSGVVNAPYYDDSVQHPLLDDNGDGVGSNELSSNEGEDGYASEYVFIGASPPAGNDPGDAIVTQVAASRFLGVGNNTVNLWAKVDDPNQARMIWLELKAPNYDPGDPGAGHQIEMDNFKKATVAFNNDRYEWSNLGGGSDPADLFSVPGTYQVFYFAKDDDTGNVSPLKESRVYKATTPNLSPNSFDLVSPANQAKVLTRVVLDWEDTSDPDGHNLTYTILLSKNDDSFSDPILKEGLLYSTCLLTPDDGIEDLSYYYWKVQAIDEYGAVRESGVRTFFTNNTNPIMTWIKGHVFNALTGAIITDATVSIGGVNLYTGTAGYYLGEMPPGSYQINVTASGYSPKSYAGVVLSEGDIVTKNFGLELTVLKGSINGDNTIDLNDAVLAMQILAGMEPSSPVFKEADVNGDGKIGHEEVMYILQKVAGLR